MALLSIANANAWKNKTQKEKDKIKSKATDYVQAKVKRLINVILEVSPQWSGDYAYNWRVEGAGYSFGYYARFKRVPYWSLRDRSKFDEKGNMTHKGSNESARYAGHPEAIKAAKAINYEVIAQLKWNSKIKIVNHSPMSYFIENHQVKLRPVNSRPPKGMQGVLEFISTQSEFRYLKT